MSARPSSLLVALLAAATLSSVDASTHSIVMPLRTQAPPPTAPTAAVWQPSTTGFTGKIKTFWFGASPNGLVPQETLELMAKYDVAGYGWQTGGVDATSVGRGEANGAAAITYIRDYLASVQNTHTTVFQYRQVQIALRLYAQSALAATDPNCADFWTKDNRTGRTCLMAQPWSTSDPGWNWSNPAASQYWVDKVVGQLAADSSMQGGRTGVFFDEVTCSCQCVTDEQQYQIGLHAMLVPHTAGLNAAGIVPIMNLKNYNAAAQNGTGSPPKCAVPEEDLIQRLHNLTWVRFYENWIGRCTLCVCVCVCVCVCIVLCVCVHAALNRPTLFPLAQWL